jgi:hypothetical protein
MSQSQVTLPALTEEENTVVDRFVERSREIVPGVEVTLAKRILRPGSNRVVCLAARTSVPINDDEMASVSDLALRLSDGTNVRLSLSFFNDAVRETITGETITETVSGGAPFNRYTYDPKRYTGRDDSKLGTVLMAMFLVAVAGAYSVSNNQFNKYFQLNTLSKYIPSGPSQGNGIVPQLGAPPFKTEQAKPNPSPQKTAFVGPVRPTARIAPVRPERAYFRVRTDYPQRVRERHSLTKARAFASPQLKNEEMLVPPPPAIPYELPQEFLKQFSGLNLPVVKPAKAPTKAPAKVETKAPASAKVETKTPASAKVETKAPASARPESASLTESPNKVVKSKPPEQAAPVKNEPAEVVSPKTIERSSADSAYVNQTSPPQLERIPAFDVPAHSSAPVPGNIWTSPSLTSPSLEKIERIAPSSP